MYALERLGTGRGWRSKEQVSRLRSRSKNAIYTAHNGQ